MFTVAEILEPHEDVPEIERRPLYEMDPLEEPLQPVHHDEEEVERDHDDHVRVGEPDPDLDGEQDEEGS